MKRFDRLRKLARQYAKEQGHELGHFTLPCKLEGEWIAARCIYCDLEVKINTNVKMHNPVGLNPRDPFQEMIGLKLAYEKNKQAGDKKPFPKRSKGFVIGPALQNKCKRKPYNSI